ncbi:MAG: 3-dehydroquinate synthase [Lachnospiraceae bacterium]|nr:3-dehydroquinate synthase [Lachnospiraceae bacterium]
MKRLTVNFDERPCYDIVIDRDFAALKDSFDFRGHRVMIVTDENVKKAVLPLLLSELPFETEVFSFAPGEGSKNLDTVKELYRVLIEKHFTRSDVILALGGGVTGDLAAFAASTYLRGISCVQVPTSLLSMVDSSIGGKTGVDFDEYKNMIGAFYMPKLVYINTSVLDTLPDREYFNGFAEVMKHGLIKSESFYRFLLDNMYEICEKDPGILSEMIEQSLMIKKEVVEQDPLEQGERMLLNFGHTIGHAIERFKGFELLHGECVALGAVAAAHISYQKGLLSMDEFYEIRDMFVPFCLPISTEFLDYEKILENVRSDKKMDGKTLRFVLLKRVGKAVISTDVTDEEIRKALDEINFDEKWED